MSAGKNLAIVLIAILLLVTVGAANSVVATERTALNAQYTNNTLESVGFYDSVTRVTQDNIQSEVESASIQQSDSIPQGFDVGQIDANQLAEESVPESYIQSQASDNIEHVFAYLHGDRVDLNIEIDAEPLKENVASAVSGQIENIDATSLLDDASTRLPGTNYRIDSNLAQSMLQSKSQYQRVQNRFHARYDSQQRQQIASDGKEQVRQRARDATSQYTAGITRGTITIQEALIDGLATDMSYREFRDEYQRGKAQLGDGAGQAVVNQINDRIGDQVSTSQWLDGGIKSELSGAQSYTQTTDTLELALPLASLLLIALLYGLSRSWQRTAKVTGGVFVVAGGFALVAVLIQSVAMSFVKDYAQQFVNGHEVVGMDLVTTFIQGIFDTLAAQSMMLVVAGIALVGLVYADNRGYLDDAKRQLGGVASGTGGAGGRVRQGQPPQGQPPQNQQDQPPQNQQQHSAEPADSSRDATDGQPTDGQSESGQDGTPDRKDDS